MQQIALDGFSYTYHEELFHFMFPKFEQQVSFGTGKGGLNKWGSKRFVADFYDKDSKTIYEIDGKSHRPFERQISDRLRDVFFKEELGIKTVRLSNRTVEDFYWEEMKKINEPDQEQFRNNLRLFTGQ